MCLTSGWEGGELLTIRVDEGVAVIATGIAVWGIAVWGNEGPFCVVLII